MEEKKIRETIDFIRFTIDFQKVKRDIYAAGEDRMENDAEHSFQLAMACWFFNATEKLGLNEEKILKYALIHDLVEVYAGDTPAFTQDKNLSNSKQERENHAAELISKKFDHFKQLSGFIDAYITKDDRESVFVYCFDKLLPIINIWLDDNRTWNEGRGSLPEALAYARSKIKDIEPFNLFIDALEKMILQSEKEKF